MYEVPILFTIHSRPDTTKQVFEKISKIKPVKLFVAADGPRKNYKKDEINCAKAREVIEKIDWECNLFTLFRDENLGCKRAMESAITWFFENVEEGIILEDDCLPGHDFFHYCKELLEKFRDNKEIFVISANNYQKNHFELSDSYYFSNYMHCWGWATWKRAWQKFDGNMSSWPKNKKESMLKKILDYDFQISYWTHIFDETYNGNINSWAYAWMHSCWENKGLTVIPKVNLVSNIGFGDSATHTKTIQNSLMKNIERVELPLKHPSEIKVNKRADKRTDYVLYSGPLSKRVMRKLKIFLKKNVISS